MAHDGLQSKSEIIRREILAILKANGKSIPRRKIIGESDFLGKMSGNLIRYNLQYLKGEGKIEVINPLGGRWAEWRWVHD